MLAAVIECADLDAEVAFFVEEMGLRVHLVTPADDPSVAVLEVPGAGSSGNGGRLELRRSEASRPGHVVLFGRVERTLRSPGGTTVEVRRDTTESPVGAAMTVPASAPSLAIVDAASGAFGVGRAGMHYRDLLPDRWGGRFIASHIRIEGGGDVADWVHFHRIRFQMIYVASGWVDVVYEDQGEPFRMHAGDCVLQPPEIRHRVLRSSAGLEVIEIGCPAEHDTIADHDLELPTKRRRADRVFSGQRFVRHVASSAELSTWVDPSFSVRDTGIGAATNGLAAAVVVSSNGAGAPSCDLMHRGEFALLVGLGGSAKVDVGSRSVEVSKGASIALPPGMPWRWNEASADHHALVVTLPVGAIQRA